MRSIRLFTVFLAISALALTALPAAASMPGSNGKIAFASNRPGGGGKFQIWTVDPVTKELTNLTGTAWNNRGPAWSPDGRKLAFHSNRAGGTHIFTMDANGVHPTQLTFGPATTTDANPSWSPDGTEIAFESNREGNAQIYIVTVATGVVRRLTSGSADHVGPSWSPRGNRIAYGTGVGCGDCANTIGNLEIHVINVNGTDDRTLTSEPAAALPLNTSRHPDWAPDGRSLVFSSARTGALEIWTMKANGKEQQQLTNDGLSDQFPYFSPDGSTVVYSSFIRQGSVELRTTSTDGTNEQTLLSGSSNQFPRWQSLPSDESND